jgi:microcystin-dependent protein
MHKIDSVGNLNNQFVDKDFGQGIIGTAVIAKWLNAVQGELVNVIENAGLTLDDLDNGQLLEAINLLQADPTPTGSIIAMPTTTPPNNYLECNGIEVSRATFAELFAVIGTTFGAGDGSTTFAVPDLRGRFIRGYHYLTTSSEGETEAGRTLGSYQPDIFASHNHSTSADNIDGNPINNVGGILNSNGNSTFPTGVLGSTGGDETRPRNISLMYCIKF